MSDHPDVYQSRASAMWFAECPCGRIDAGYSETEARQRRDQHQRGHVERRAS